jgi:hypothetical protein
MVDFCPGTENSASVREGAGEGALPVTSIDQAEQSQARVRATILHCLHAEPGAVLAG